MSIDVEREYVDAEGRRIELVEQLGTGIQGAVFRTADGMALKAPFELDEEGVRRCLEIPADRFLDRSGHRWIVWPRAAVYDRTTREFAGYTMDYVPIGRAGTWRTAGGSGPWVSLRTVLKPRDRRADGLDVSYRWTVRAATHIATAAWWAESAGVAAVDLNARNVVVHRDSALATLLDPESLSVDGRPRAMSEDLKPPEELDEAPVSATATARWSLAVAVLRVLLQGVHPFSGVRWDSGEDPENTPASNVRAGWCAMLDPVGGRSQWVVEPDEALSKDVLELARRCFFGGADERPAAEQWARALDALDRSLAPCRRSRRHQHLPYQACPWCAAAVKFEQDPYAIPEVTG